MGKADAAHVVVVAEANIGTDDSDVAALQKVVHLSALDISKCYGCATNHPLEKPELS